ncbi:hypothetical protein RclHR1_25540004 [Rhizophagus clarus]|uniref:RING-type domain-containing protein n=1 Tax=Rhizophagus clarus TaxID=94130 RepID=A0A2Z6QZF7_9GLOM|nr:hypothetical protein RclHR1_25540004 [Rhizophagus clarus]GES81993.1 hypothetical protein GLOIN_2v1709640 [Rhizophagus clarus]
MTGIESTKDSSYQIPERPHPSLTNYRNFAYSILKYLEDDMVGDKEIPQNQLLCVKCLEEITADFLKDTVFLSCKHIVHYDCIANLHKRCPICSDEDLLMFSVEQSSSTAQKKCSSDSAEKSSSKKAKKTKSEKKVLSKLKNFIEELSSETSQDSVVMEEGTGDFFDLYNSIINMEGQEEIAK